MIVNEIFSSIEGEGKRSGKLCTFIRLAGCNLNCSYCDTRYAQESNSGQRMGIISILDKCRDLDNRLVTITGGEPLIHFNIEELIDVLINAGFQVNVETNGSIPLTRKSDKNFFYTMDYKCPSSNEESSMNLGNFHMVNSFDVIKFVVGNVEDLIAMKQIIDFFNPLATIYISPVWEKIEMRDIVQFMKEHKLQKCHLQVQLHKIIWPADMRGV